MSVERSYDDAIATVRPVSVSAARQWRWFVAIGLALYLLLYGASEALVYHYGERNRFYMVKTAPLDRYDYVVLGASHAMPLGFADMNDRLERLTGASVINLSIEGAGVLPNRLMLDYFFERKSARAVVYVLDSFAFYSSQWNEDRLADAGLFRRAPFDPALAATLWRHPWARPVLPGYVSGFYKVNDADRFEPDRSDAERNKFDRTYRAVPFLDRQRIAYLYPKAVDPDTMDRYLAAFEDLVRLVQDHGMAMIVIKPPVPDRVRKLITGEAEFEARLAARLAPLGVDVHDFSRVSNDDAFFYDTDHLNRTGVIDFTEKHLAPLLRAASSRFSKPGPEIGPTTPGSTASVQR